ncbi:extracellular solute-binding protein [Clostridium sp. Marseille-Q2269]|uniref:extracellular solute-binding protein n=1 Tax=Clostridium sp. Marseille-Q2269 TaxID=2942205 RepID=UPI00207411E2|nr:extracellular solute-binding protein [Clostridium sp. Marseille-Q2269]
MKKGICKIFISITLITIFMISFVGCENNKKDANKKSNSGEAITVLLPPWYQKGLEKTIPDFEADTGIKVKLEILDWEPLQDRIVTSCSTGVAPADVTEFSWDWTNTYGEAGWYEPLNKYFSDDMWKDIATKDVFSHKGKYMAVPIYNDFRLTYVDTADFTSAGIKDIPTTADSMYEAAKKIKAAGVCNYPILLPLSATSATTTPWFMLTKAYGGELFDNNWNPLFAKKDSAGYKAMSWVMNAYKDGLINPAVLDYKGTDVVDHFKKGDSSIDIAGWAGNITEYTKKDSAIASTVKVIQVPGTKDGSRTYGLQEGVGIPTASKHKEAAAKFIKWINKEKFMENLFTEDGIFPNHASTITALTKANKMPQGNTIKEAMSTIQPLFPQGAPKWYAAWESDVATYMNQIAKGQLTMDQGLKSIAGSAAKLKAKSK